MKICENEKEGKETGVKSLDPDGPTHKFSIGTPRIRSIYQEPSTPEMPDLSSVTQDICKVCVHPKKTKLTIDQHSFRILHSDLLKSNTRFS